ncbi:hypothetical protein B0H16DRAFT_1725994 [Mycena metata]|uniref:Uncharacterized protein n=1 Tax=Mycena metata TaxID=1033252 RepID=A0AAD7IRB7_9AGAR|nr:hypothetical protein B0H16DRAFT_1725994 [Mycena metata]
MRLRPHFAQTHLAQQWLCAPVVHRKLSSAPPTCADIALPTLCMLAPPSCAPSTDPSAPSSRAGGHRGCCVMVKKK